MFRNRASEVELRKSDLTSGQPKDAAVDRSNGYSNDADSVKLVSEDKKLTYLEMWFGSTENMKAMIAASFLFAFSDYFIGHFEAYYLMGGVDTQYGAWGYVPLVLYAGVLTALPMARHITASFGTRLVSAFSLIAFMIFLSIITVLPVVWCSQNLLSIDIFYYYLPNWPGFIILVFISGMCYGIFYPSINQTAIVAEHYAKRPWLGFYYGLNAFALGIGFLTGQLSASLDISQYGNIPAYVLFWASTAAMTLFTLGLLYWLHDPEREALLFAQIEADRILKKHEVQSLVAGSDSESNHTMNPITGEANIERSASRNDSVASQRRESLMNYLNTQTASFVQNVTNPMFSEKGLLNQPFRAAVVDTSVIRTTNVSVDVPRNSYMLHNPSFSSKSSLNPKVTLTDDGYLRYPSKDSIGTTPPSVDTETQQVSTEQKGEKMQALTTWQILSRRDILILGALIFIAGFTDQSVRAWSSPYFTLQIGSGNILQSMGYDTYHVAYGIGAFTIDRFRRFYLESWIIGISGVSMTVGMILYLIAGAGTYGAPRVASGQVFMAIAGSALIGFGVIPILSIAMSKACTLPGIPYSAGTSIVAMFDFSGRIFGCLVIAGIFTASESLLYGLIIQVIIFAAVPYIAFFEKTN